MAFDRECSIIAQSAGKDAAELTKALIGANIVDSSDAFEVYSDLKARIFADTLALAGAETVVERFEGASTPATQPVRPSGGDNGGPATLVIKSGKHQGKTIAAVYDEDPSYIEWLADKSNNTFLKGKAQEFLAA